MLVRKRQEIARLGQMLGDAQTAGITTEWLAIERDLQELPLRTIVALVYRVERQLANSYEEGARSSGARVL